MDSGQSRGAGKSPERNDPCPCGSGRKYKDCCALRSPAPVAPRRAALGVFTEHGRAVVSEGLLGRELSKFGRAPAAARPAPAVAAAEPAAAREAKRCHAEGVRVGRMGQVTEAVALLSRAARLDPTNVTIRHDLGLTLLYSGHNAKAADAFATAIRLDPTLASAHYFYGICLSRQGRVDQAIYALQRASTIAPKHADAHFQLATLLKERGHNADAAGAFERAASAAGNTTGGRIAAALALVARGREDEGVTLLRRAKALDPKSVEVLRPLSNLLIAMGRFKEADEELAAGLAIDPRGAVFYYTYTRTRKITPADRPLIERMLGVLELLDDAARDRMFLSFALGKAYDDLKEYEPAMRHFDGANRVRGGTATLDRKRLAAAIDHDMQMFTREAFEAAAQSHRSSERPVFIVGMPRSGTTLVEQIVSSHPGVAAGGELTFWGANQLPENIRSADAISGQVLDGLVTRYEEVLRGISPDALRVTDKNPFNFIHLGLIRLAFPRAFVIHCRRHPVDTCLSIYTTNLTAHDISFMGNREDLVFYYREYERLMQHWREVLPADRFLEVDYETLVTDREAQTRRLVSFCGLPWDDACLAPEQNERAISTASVWQARQPVYRTSVERWRNYEPWLGALAELLPAAPAASVLPDR